MESDEFSGKGEFVLFFCFLNRRCYSMFVVDENEPIKEETDRAGEKE